VKGGNVARNKSASYSITSVSGTAERLGLVVIDWLELIGFTPGLFLVTHQFSLLVPDLQAVPVNYVMIWPPTLRRLRAPIRAIETSARYAHGES
jgi:hypothetical protein